jgi:hypothetical protein
LTNNFKKAQFIKDQIDSKVVVEVVAIEDYQDELPTCENDYLQICVTDSGTIEEDSSEDEKEETEANNLIPHITSSTSMSHLQEFSQFLLINKCDCMKVYNLKLVIYDAIENSKNKLR